MVYDGTEGEAVPPAAVHVQDVHVVVGGSHAPAPDLTQQKIFKFKCYKNILDLCTERTGRCIEKGTERCNKQCNAMKLMVIVKDNMTI